MLDQAQTNSARQKLADSFLRDQRSANSGTAQAGWGQFVGQTDGVQVGLYGTCAGLITVAAAYGHDRIPQGVVDYLTELWQQRNTAGSNGARYFALTARRAFFLMALRRAGHPSLAQIAADADRELRERILNDGLFVSWQFDQTHKSATGDEFSTAIVVLAYGLTARERTDIPPEILRSAESLQRRIEGSAPLNIGVRKFYLAAVTTALDEGRVSRQISRLVRLNRPQENNRDQDTLYFWDYWFLGPIGPTSRRDYFHVPSDAVDITLACGSTTGRFHKLAALDLATEDVKTVLDLGLYFAGRELAASNNQAWMSLALSRIRLLVPADTRFNRFVLKYLRGIPDNIGGGVILPAFVLALIAVASAVPDRLLELLQWTTLVGPAAPKWWGKVSVGVQAAGLIGLTAWGETLAKRIVAYVRSRLP